MRLARVSLALLVMSVAAVALVRVPWARQRCNIEKRRAERLIERSETIASDFQRQTIAARAAERMEQCVAAFPADWQVHFLAGALHQIAGRAPVAIKRYRTALDLEPRPEIYYSISLLQFGHGETAEGILNAEKAASFNLGFADMYEKQLRDRLWVQALERERRLLANGK